MYVEYTWLTRTEYAFNILYSCHILRPTRAPFGTMVRKVEQAQLPGKAVGAHVDRDGRPDCLLSVLGHPTHTGPFERCTVIVARRLGSGGRIAVFVHPNAGWSLWYPWCMLHREDTDWVDGAASSDARGLAGPH